MRTLVLDNYDSFTYNLVHLIRELGYGAEMDIYRNDAISLEAVEQYDKILLSPGPGVPKDAGIMMDVIQKYAPHKSILGICLGLQGIAESFGGTLINMKEVCHGLALNTLVTQAEATYFQGVPNNFDSGRYHSWMVAEENFPEDLQVTAKDEENRIMALSHKKYDVHGLQFHPESILTPHGKTMIANWLRGN